jgi:protein-serine/threonine kinase
VKRGFLYLKEDGLLSFSWSKRWVILSETELSIHKNEHVYEPLAIILLREIDSVSRSSKMSSSSKYSHGFNVTLTPYALSTDSEVLHFGCGSDDELYSWMDELCQVFKNSN